MMTDVPETRAKEPTPEERARPTAPWRFVLALFFITFLAMLGSIYWIIRTGKL
jgi:hypothetical protein